MTIIRNVLLIVLIASLASCGGIDDPMGSLSSSAASVPPAATYAVGGGVQALKGSGLVLQNNGADSLAVAADGSFKFAQQQSAGAAYAVTVQTQPSNPPQACTVSNGSGTVSSSAVSNIVVNCATTAASTAVGTAVGQPSTKTIDAAGGSLVSPDGKLTLTIPPNAVANATDFSIQPITNQAPGGIGGGYRLSPEGQTFSSPVQISFQYSSADVAGSLPSLLQVVSQNSAGYWVINSAIELDTTQQTVTASVPHFSDWTLAAAAYLDPGTAVVPVGGTVQFTLNYCPPVGALASSCLPTAAVTNAWAADGVDGGNAEDGTITPADADATEAYYHAPGIPPLANPVAVSAQLAQTSAKVLLVSNVTVADACGAPDPSCTYKGWVTATINYSSVGPTSNATANINVTVTWGLPAPYNGDGVADLVPLSGTIVVTSNAAGCVISPKSAPLPTVDNYLSLDFALATYSGSGGFAGAPGVYTETCTLPDGTTNTGAWEGGYWFYAPGPPQSPAFEPQSSGAMVGNYAQAPLGSWSWNFQPVSSSSP
jgi:hypothetical protein